MASNPNYDAREAWLIAFTNRTRPHFERIGAPLPDAVRTSIGFTSRGARGKRIGECWATSASSDGHFEIFIKPTIETDSRIAGVLTHELVHAAVGIDAGHGAPFKRVATALGLTGKMTATTEGDKWHEWADPIIAELGPFPYAPMKDGRSSGPKKQTTRLIKLECDECGWTARVTRVHIDQHSCLLCPTPTCDGKLMEG